MIHVLFDDQVTVRRLKSSGGNKTTYQATATVDCEIREMGDDDVQGVDLHLSRGFRIYCDIAADIKEGDKIQLVEKVDAGDRNETRTRQFQVVNIDVPKGWLVDYKQVIVEELVD